MAFANLGRHKRKTVLVVISLSLSVVLLNILVTFTSGFDMEKYLAKLKCADFIVSSTDYFSYNYSAGHYISPAEIEEIKTHTSASLSGCGYTLAGYRLIGWMPEEHWLQDMMHYTSEENARVMLAQQDHRGNLVSQSALMEGLDESLFDKVTVIEGDLSPLFQKDTNAIAILCTTDDYGNAEHLDFYPPLGSVQTITYIDEESSHDVDYTVCAYVTVPYSMSFRYYTTDYSFVLPIEKLNYDSRHESIPMFYLFDTPDTIAESSAEDYLADLTTNDLSGLMYESKATIRSEFEGFQHIFLLFGGLLCAIIWLVGILNFFNAILTGIFSRKREFAVLQAVGMTGKQLKSMLVYEGLFYTLAAALGAMLLSLAINPLIGCLLENMFWFFSAKFTILPIIFTLPLFALLGWLIPSLMYSYTAKYSIVEQL